MTDFDRGVGPLKLEYKPDAPEAQERMRAFWAGEILDRPCVSVTGPRDGSRQPPLPQVLAPDFDLAAGIARFDEWASATFFMGEAFPYVFPTYGPDSLAAFVGADLTLAFDTDTSWAASFVEDWSDVRPFTIDPENKWWKATLELCREAAEAGRGRFLVSQLDMHSNMDCLLAIRGAARLCMDLIDRPDEVLRAVRWVDALYKPVYDAVWEAAGMGERGSTCWLDMWSDGRVQVVECDFCCMVSPEHFRKFVLPSLEYEVSCLDHSMYHLDGVGALEHLDDILSIPGLHGIQWVPGEGQKPVWEYKDVLKKIQQAGKAVHAWANPDELRALHRELRPEKSFYQTWCRSESEAQVLLDWLRANT